ncbi:MBL fold metallo-hydrolase [Eubacteriales bacterium OttesenSCG-928-G02]|nr:MBL fold metallo-hydrolase [Eubacteriales bacterium OttesenSCG-928-G02]
MSNLLISTLFSSSKGNCTYIRKNGEEFLIDAGISARAIECSLKQLGSSLANIKGIFITHEHSDHIKGLEIVSKHYHIPIYAPTLSAAHIGCISDNVRDLINIIDDGESVEFSELSFKAYRTPHDSKSSVCYKVDFGTEKLGYATDIGHISDRVLDALIGCEYIVLESNHDIDMLKQGAYPFNLKKRILGKYGHLSNSSCAELVPLLVSKGAVSILLAHLSDENNKPAIAFNESYKALMSKNMKITTKQAIGDVYLNIASKKEQSVLIYK